MLTSDPIYLKPYKPAIYINNTSNSTNYYTYDPWTDSGTLNKPTHLSLSLSENNHGKFVCQIEDGGQTLNRNNINKGARLIIKVGKYAGQMTQVLSGLIRETADSRGSDRKDLYTLSGSSTSIRNNERIIYYVKQAAKLATGQININDTNMQAVLLLVAGYGGAYSIQPNYGSEGGLGIVNISNTSANSNVKNFIADINIEFGEIQDLINVIEEHSGSEYNLSATDIANLRYELTSLAGGRGFTIKNQTYRISGQDDDADDTMYLIRKNWKYSDSVYKADSYANRLSGILASEPVPSTREDMGFTAAGFSSEVTINIEHAEKFRPSHAHCLPGDFLVVAAETGDSGGKSVPWPARFRICTDTGGVPTNAGGIVANIDFLPEQFDSPILMRTTPGFLTPQESFKMLSEQIFYNSSNARIDFIDLDTTKDYWFIASNDNMTLAANFLAWAQDPDVSSIRAWNSGGTFSTNSAGGSGYTVFTPATGKFCFEMPMRRSQSLIMHDPKAIKNLGSGLSTGGTPIESHLPSFPSIIKTRQAGYSYMANQLYYMAKPRANYAIPQVTAPNICPLPGDPIVISDTILGFSTPGNKVIFTRCGDLSLSWGNLDGSGLTYDAPTKLNINPVGNIPRYK